MTEILQAILPIFLLIGLGVVINILQQTKLTAIRRFWKTLRHKDDQWSSVLNKFALYVSLPALIVHTLANASLSDLADARTLVITVALLSAFALAVLMIVRILQLKKEIANAYFMCSFFGNIAYIGPPFILALMPNAGATISLLIALHVAVAFTVGLYVLEVSKRGSCDSACVRNNVAANPLIISVIVGILLLLLRIPLPSVVNQALSMLAASASPVVLIAIGLFLAKKIRIDTTLAHAVIISILKLVIMPGVFFFAFLAWGNVDPTGFTISILESGMPVALSIFALTEIYPLDKRIVAKAITISTIASLFSLTFLSHLLI